MKYNYKIRLLTIDVEQGNLNIFWSYKIMTASQTNNRIVQINLCFYFLHLKYILFKNDTPKAKNLVPITGWHSRGIT